MIQMKQRVLRKKTKKKKKKKKKHILHIELGHGD